MARMLRRGAVVGIGALLLGVPAAAQAQSSAVQREVAYCDDWHGEIDAKRYADVAASVTTDGVQKSLAQELASKQKGRRECLQRASDKLKSNPAAVREIETHIAANDKTMMDRFAAARAEFELDVGKYLAPANYFGKPELGSYKAALASARNIPRFHKTCGAFDFTWVPVDTRAVNNARARHEAFKKCFDKYTDLAAKISVTEFGRFQIAADRLAGTRRYICSQWAKPNCVADAEWKRFGGDLFTQKNRALVDAAERQLDAEKDLAYATDRKVSEWVRELSRRIEEHNRS